MTQETKDKILAIAERRRKLLVDLGVHPSGIAWCERHTALCDEITEAIYDDLMSTTPGLPALAVIATGGYGRSELAPYSDLDLTVVPSDEASSELDSAIRRLFQDIHWAFCTALRMDVGYAYRLISDAPGLDAKTRTGLLDMRLVAGSSELAHHLEEALVASFAAGEFLLAKIEERNEMFARFHDTPLVVEPHLKEGAGGLRCFQCANWLREAIGERPARPSQAYDTIYRFRNLLHLKAGKYQDLLSRQRQAEIADHLGVDVYDMMSEVARAGLELNAWYQRTKETLHETRFALSKGVLGVQGEVRLAGEVDAGEAAVGVAIATQLGLKVSDLPIRAAKPACSPSAIFAISTGEQTLRNLDRCGLLGQLLPELEQCKVLFPADTVHAFTVFEHTMRVMRFLDSIEPGTFLGDVRASITDLEPLYLGALLHDVGKVVDGVPHAESGAELSKAVCRRWNLADSVSDQVVWLVANHLEMAKTIRIRDLLNPQTVEDFSKTVGDMDRLALLTLLTWADVNAVHTGAWTPSQNTFLQELYSRTAAMLQGDGATHPDPALSRQRLLRQLRGKDVAEEKIQHFVLSLPAHYLTTTPPDLVKLHMDFAEKAVNGETTVELYNRNDLSATEVTVCTLDRAGLLSRLLGVIYAFDLSVGLIRACTTMTSPAVALDVFTINFGGRPVPQATAQQLNRAIQAVLSGERTVEELLTARGKDPAKNQRFFKYAYHAGAPGILEVRADRGRGMPYRFSRLIAEQGWNIVSARVGQWAGSAAAAFYVLGPGGRPLEREEVDAAMALALNQNAGISA